MPKISSYPVNIDEVAEGIIQIGSSNFRSSIADILMSSVVTQLQVGAYVWDFLSTPLLETDDNQPYPWVLANIGLGPAVLVSSEENHPGIVQGQQNGSNTGIGFWLGHASNILLAGEEETELILKFDTLTDVVLRFGFGDNHDGTGAPTDAVIITCNATSAFGRTNNNTTASTTATTLTITTGVWYRFKVALNANATRADFYIYDDSNNLLWTDFLTTNIPVAAGRETSHGFSIHKTSVGTASLARFDYMSLLMPKTLAR